MSGVGNSFYSPFVIKGGQTLTSQAFIGQGWINNAMIGDDIQSNTWDGMGNTGWHINKSGFATFNSVNVRGTVYASAGDLNNVTTQENCTILETLNASRINGPLMQSKSFSFGLTTTNATNTVYWDGTFGKGNVPMTLTGTVFRVRNNSQGASKLIIAGNEIAPAIYNVPRCDITIHTYSVDIRTGSATMVFAAGSLNQSSSEYCQSALSYLQRSQPTSFTPVL